MAKINNSITIASLLLLLLAGFYIINSQTPHALGSVVDGNNYYSTSTNDTLSAANAQASFLGAKTTVLKAGPGALAQVTISSTTLGKMAFYNGTTTSALLRNNALYPTTTIAIIGTSTAAGTYTYDATFSAGLIVETTQDFNGTFTITYR